MDKWINLRLWLVADQIEWLLELSKLFAERSMTNFRLTLYGFFHVAGNSKICPSQFSRIQPTDPNTMN